MLFMHALREAIFLLLSTLPPRWRTTYLILMMMDTQPCTGQPKRASCPWHSTSSNPADLMWQQGTRLAYIVCCMSDAFCNLSGHTCCMGTVDKDICYLLNLYMLCVVHSFQPTCIKMAGTTKSGLETICIFPGFDYATAHDGHLWNAFCQMCIYVVVTVRQWQWLWQWQWPRKYKSHCTLYASNCCKLIECFTSSISTRQIAHICLSHYYSAFCNLINVCGWPNTHQAKCT